MADGGISRKAKILPYKHAIAAYGAAIGGLPSKFANGGWQKNWPHHSTMVPPFDNNGFRSDHLIYALQLNEQEVQLLHRKSKNSRCKRLNAMVLKIWREEMQRTGRGMKQGILHSFTLFELQTFHNYFEVLIHQYICTWNTLEVWWPWFPLNIDTTKALAVTTNTKIYKHLILNNPLYWKDKAYWIVWNVAFSFSELYFDH